MKGKVIYSSGGNYKVLANGVSYFSKPLGIFRKNNTKILVGDCVELTINENKEGLKEINTITNLYERNNEFIRPNISNIDFSMILTSIEEPKFNDYYLDKLITIFNLKNVKPILIFTKSDLAKNDDHLKIIKEYERCGFKIFITKKQISEKQKGIIKEFIKNKFIVITGQTGVGKSTFLNNLNSNLHLKTGEISKSLGRGKHTTRHSEAFEIFEDTFLIDTPGFSSLDLSKFNERDIFRKFLDFEKYVNDCKFTNCSHLTEENCGVKNQNYSERTWKNYKKILMEIKNGKRKMK